MKDVNKDGKIDELDLHHNYMGRSLSLCIACILIIVIMAVFDKGVSAFPFIVSLAGLYCGRAIGGDIASKRREQ